VNAVVAAGAIGQGNPVTAAGRNFAYRRSAFKAVGGYGTGVAGASGDDDLLLQRMAKGGAKVRFAINPETFVLASGAATFGEWLRVKRRHLSAGKRYSFLFILLAAVLYIFNVGMVVTAGMSIAGMIPWHWPFWLWGVKALADGATLAKGAIILEERNWVGAWLVAELLSPLLFTAMVPLSLSGKVRWKGRELSR